MQICTLLKSGPEYEPQHLYRLADSIVRHNPDARIDCLTDIGIDHPAINPIHKRTIYPKWWGKLQLFSIYTDAPVLYMDIDTLCVGNLSGLLRDEPGITMLPNVYMPGRVGSGVMSWRGDFRYIFEQFRRQPERIMQQYTTSEKWGDQAFIEHHLKQRPDLFGAECLSYKVNVRRKIRKLPQGAKLIYFHGKPRPWRINDPILEAQHG